MLYIWWLSQYEILSIEAEAAQLPEYLQRELSSINGRPLRGRLWTTSASKFEGAWPFEVSPWPETALSKWLGSWCGGIVFRAEDVEKLKQLPGTITNFELKRI